MADIVSIRVHGLKELEKDFQPAVYDRMVVRALNRTARGARTEASRAIRERYIVKARDVSNALKFRYARRGRHQAVLQFSGRSIPLAKFQVRSRAVRRIYRQAHARVLRGGAYKPITGGFLATMRSGHKGVFVREGSGRLPIRERFGPSIPQMMSHEASMARVRKRINEDFDKNLTQQYNYEMGKRK